MPPSHPFVDPPSQAEPSMPRIAALSAAVLIGLSGCGKTYQFELEATVTSEADGTPIAGATIHRNMWGEKSDPKTEEVVLRTDAAGRAVDSFAVTDAAFSAGQADVVVARVQGGIRTRDRRVQAACRARRVAHAAGGSDQAPPGQGVIRPSHYLRRRGRIATLAARTVGAAGTPGRPKPPRVRSFISLSTLF